MGGQEQFVGESALAEKPKGLLKRGAAVLGVSAVSVFGVGMAENNPAAADAICGDGYYADILGDSNGDGVQEYNCYPENPYGLPPPLPGENSPVQQVPPGKPDQGPSQTPGQIPEQVPVQVPWQIPIELPKQLPERYTAWVDRVAQICATDAGNLQLAQVLAEAINPQGQTDSEYGSALLVYLAYHCNITFGDVIDPALGRPASNYEHILADNVLILEGTDSNDMTPNEEQMAILKDYAFWVFLNYPGTTGSIEV